MRRKFKKITAALLVVVMILAQFTAVYGSSTTDSGTTKENSGTAMTMSAKELVKLAKEKQELSSEMESKRQALIEKKKTSAESKSIQKKADKPVDNGLLTNLKGAEVNTIDEEAKIVPGKMIVKYKANVSDSVKSVLNAKVSALSAKTNKKLGFTELKLSKSDDVLKAVNKLKDDPNVEYVEPVYERKVLTVVDSVYYPDEYYSNGWQWGLEAIAMDDMWSDDVNDALAGITIAIIDSGIDSAHSEFQGNIVAGYDFVRGDDTPNDENGHGTHVAGIAAAKRDGNGMAGVAGGAKIMPVKAFDNNGSGDTVDIINSILYAVNHGADVINMSFGSYGYSRAEEAAIKYAVEKGVVLVAAAGNEGYGKASYPAAYDGVISVGAVDWYYGEGFGLAYFSNYGEEIDVVAPGVDILSTIPEGLDNLESGIGDSEGDGYALLSGTSMAAPFAAGMAALILAKNEGLDSDGVLSVMQASAYGLGDGYKLINGGGGNITPPYSYRKLFLDVYNGAADNARTFILTGADYRHTVSDEVYGSFDLMMVKYGYEEDGTLWMDNPEYIDEITIPENSTGEGSASYTLEDGGSYRFYAAGNGKYMSSDLVDVYVQESDDDGNESFDGAVGLTLGQETSAAIGTYGDADYYKFTVTEDGYYAIGSTGDTDTMGFLYDGTGGVPGALITDNDDSDNTLNFCILRELGAGKSYYVKVTGYDVKTLGEYGLVVKKAPISGTVSLPQDAGAVGEGGLYVGVYLISKIWDAEDEEYEYDYVDEQLVTIASGAKSAGYAFTGTDVNTDYIIEYWTSDSDAADYVPLGYYKASGTVISMDSADIVGASKENADITLVKKISVTDTVGNTIGTPAEITVGGTKNDSMGYGGDEDCYKLTATETGTYIIGCLVDDEADFGASLISIMDENEIAIHYETLDYGYADGKEYAYKVVELQEGETYYIGITNFCELFNPFDYQLNVAPATALSCTLSLPTSETAAGTMEGWVIAANPDGISYEAYCEIPKGSNTSGTYTMYVPAASGYTVSYYCDTTKYAEEGYYANGNMVYDPKAATAVDMSSSKEVNLKMISLLAIPDESNSKENPAAVTLGTAKTGVINYYADEDYFKFHADKDGEYRIKIESLINMGVFYWDSNGQWAKYGDSVVSEDGYVTVMTKTLAAGDHYLMLCGADGGLGSYEFTVDLMKQPPVASNVIVTGTAKVGYTLTGSYTYTDIDDDAQGTSTFRWLRLDTTNGTYAPISGATAKTYTLTSNDKDKYIKFEVTPVAVNAPTTGTAVASDPKGPIAAATTNNNGGDDDNHGGNGSTSGGTTGTTTDSQNNGTTVTTENSGSGTATITKAADGTISVDVSVNASKLSSALSAAGTAPITIDAKTSVNANNLDVDIPANVFTQAASSQKPVVVNTNNVSFAIEPGTFNISDPNAAVNLGVAQLSLDAVPEAARSMDTAANEVSLVFDFDLSVGGSKVTDFNKPMTITVKFDASKVSDLSKVGVYYFNEKDGVWEYVGGHVNADGTITFTVEHFSKYTVMEYKKTFDDIKTHWAKSAIELLISKHIASAASANSFGPETNITRAEFATMISKALNLKTVDPNKLFIDVPINAAYNEHIYKAYKAGIIDGVSDKEFAPKQYITREQMATMLMRAYSYATGKKLDDIVTTMQIRFKDEGKIESWAKRNVILADATGLMTGNPGGNFNPKDKTTKAQAVIVIKRLMEKLNRL